MLAFEGPRTEEGRGLGFHPEAAVLSTGMRHARRDPLRGFVRSVGFG